MPFNGGGFSGGGFGRSNGGVSGPIADLTAAAQNAWNAVTSPTNDPWNPDPWAQSPTPTQQAAGVKLFGNVWASNACASCDTAITQLQGALSRALAVLGRGGLPVDHKIGPTTVAAMAVVADAATKQGLIADGFKLSQANTAERIAKNADWLAPVVQGVASRLTAVQTATAPQPFQPLPGGGTPAPQPPATMPGMQVNAMPGIFAPGTKWRARLPYIIGGLVLVLGAGVTVLILTAPSRASDEE